MRIIGLLLSAALFVSAAVPELEKARDAQDRAALDRLARQYAAAAQSKPDDANAQYTAALAWSYAAEVATEQRDKNAAEQAAEAGIKIAEKTVALNPKSSEYHRILGTLCGQVIPANKLLALRYGKCARDEVDKAVQLDPKSAIALVSRGVGNYYMPASFGGGVEPAIRDFQGAIAIDPKLPEAHMWLGIALRKAGRSAEAHQALETAVKLNPRRVWTKQQLDKTPAK
jgi:tetratricopeptide (TPR) repeat protein